MGAEHSQYTPYFRLDLLRHFEGPCTTSTTYHLQARLLCRFGPTGMLCISCLVLWDRLVQVSNSQNLILFLCLAQASDAISLTSLRSQIFYCKASASPCSQVIAPLMYRKEW